MSAHLCGVCCHDMDQHSEECTFGEDATRQDGVHSHWPALCCLGCLCGSFEQAHVGASLPDLNREAE